MDDELLRRVRANGGLIDSMLLGDHPGRVARRSGLVVVQPRVLVAATQPVGAWELVVAARTSIPGVQAFLGRTALWLYGFADEPEVVQVGVPHSTSWARRPPVVVRRVAASVLNGRRTMRNCSVVAFEVALVQASERRSNQDVLELVGEALRSRRTTIPRLRGRCVRGFAGSAAVRAAVDELVGTSLDGAVRRLHGALKDRGINGLRTEVRFTNSAGASAYVDLLDEQSRTAVEVDGFLSHTERQRFRADRRRDRWLVAEHDLLTVRVDAAETMDDLPRVADELAALVLVRRAAAGVADARPA
jgi:very-short-patch-repair endonuclease